MPTLLPLLSTSTWMTDEGLLAVCANSYFSKKGFVAKPHLLLLPEMRAQNRIKLAEFAGKRNALLYATENHTFLGLDNKLMVSGNLKTWEKVLEVQNTENILWHIAEASDGALFVQEYGVPLTSVYRSTDGGETWRRIVTSKSIDRRARHFHSIAYDRYRDLLVVTLGDGNLVKVATSMDQGDTWKPVYRSAYQCLPIVVLRNCVVFGMDSAISNGTLLWDISANSWDSIHIRCTGKIKTIGNMQSSDLKRLENGVWVMSTGGGSLLYSNDLRQWRLSIIGKENQFEAHTISNEKQGIVAASMCDSTAIIDSKELTDTRKQSEVQQYRAFLPRMKGFGYVLKRFPFLLNATKETGSRE